MDNQDSEDEDARVQGGQAIQRNDYSTCSHGPRSGSVLLRERASEEAMRDCARDVPADQWLIEAPPMPTLGPEQLRALAELIVTDVVSKSAEENDLELPSK